MIRIKPSSLWQGNPVAGSRWTQEQLSVLATSGVSDPERCAVGTIERRARSNDENWTMPPPLVRTDLPCLAVTRDRKRGKLVTPAGATSWLDIVAWQAAARG